MMDRLGRIESLRRWLPAVAVLFCLTSATAFVVLLAEIHRDYGYQRRLDMQNLLGSHDTSRIGSAVVNPKYRQDHRANLKGNRDYDVRKPNAREKVRWRQMVAFLFLAPGVPYTYYGDEVGMWDADDPDCRKPMVWDDLSYDTERAHPLGLSRPIDSVEPDRDMLAFYHTVTQWRHDYAALRRGTFKVLLTDDRRRLVAFRREHEGMPAVAVFNASDETCELTWMQLGLRRADSWGFVAGQAGAGGTVPIAGRGFVLLVQE